MPVEYNHEHENEVTVFAETNFRSARRRFGIKTDDRRRHMYVLGKTGMGKTTLMENMIVSDINAGHGCAYIDPHGDTAEKIIEWIPTSRINDVVYFNPADTDYPMGFNILETDNDAQKPLVASGLMGVFKKIWPDVWSARMEYILLNCVLALLDYPGATLLGINRLLVDKEYRARVVSKIRDPIVKTFWVAEFASWSEKYATEAIAPVQNKVGQFLSSSVIRNIVAQVKSSIDPRRIMDDGKILIANLSKGRIGEDNMRLLGGMLITKIQLGAQERQNLPEKERRDFYVYVDEFQNFANESFASILSEARKYRLNLIVAHQYIEQLDEKVAPAVFGNVGTMIIMRVGAKDAEFLETEFAPTFTPEDLVNLAKFQFYLKLMVDGVATPPFSAASLPPIAKKTGNEEKVIKVSRERYAEPRPVIEEKVLQWSGMELSTSLAPAVPQQGENTTILPNAAELVNAEPVLNQLQYPTLKTEDERADEAAGDYLKIRPERMAAIQATVSAAGAGFSKKEKPKFEHTCTRCGKKWNLPIQLDTTRPMYCAECRPLVLEERKKTGGGADMKKAKRQMPPPESGGSGPAAGAPRRESRDTRTPIPNKPRVVGAPGVDLPKGQVRIVRDDASPAKASLLEEIIKAKGGVPVETRKKELEKRADTSVSASVPSAPPSAPVAPVRPVPASTPTSVQPGQRVVFDLDL